MPRISRFLELPPEIIYNLPKMTLIGNLQIKIENHRGLIEYTTGKVRVAVNQGEVEILGKNLIICSISREGLCLEGEIDGFKYLG
ncbi:MAG TPA: sporulation protein YqfC [Clostridia bacterium]|jgi:sporulation protein YqfC|nr:sporulation protein YqfC [Clostridia bacterium]